MLTRLAALTLAGLLAGCQMEEDAGLLAPTFGPPQFSAYAASPTVTGSAGGPRARPTAGTSAAPVPRAWIPQVQPRQWRYIVLHHSDTDKGSAAAFDRAHRARGWECLGYDFVIGNGTQSGDGEIEVGQRWTRQMDGAHAGVALYNQQGIGICLVGNFEATRPTAAQMKALTTLTAYLMRTYNIPPQNVIGHNTAKNGKTACPGKYFDVAAVRRQAAQYAGLDDLPSESRRLALGGELLRDTNR
jgi:N-acetylmuramoyl-L-alanine amidase